MGRGRTRSTLSLPTVYIQGAVDGVNPPEASQEVPSKFNGPFAFKLLDGVGHFPTREVPATVAAVLIEHFS